MATVTVIAVVVATLVTNEANALVASLATTTVPVTATTVESAAAPTTAPAVAPAQLHASVSSFVTDWNFVAEQIADIRPDVAAPVVTESAFVRETNSVAGTLGGSELFATRLGDSGFVGGALDHSGRRTVRRWRALDRRQRRPPHRRGDGRAEGNVDQRDLAAHPVADRVRTADR